MTFLFTDVEGSTGAWLRNPQAMGAVLARHDELIERLVAAHGGHVVRPRGEGDSRFAVFSRASEAVTAACAIQLALLRERWPLPEPLRVRMAVHTGEADLRLGDYYGPAVNHCARLRAVAHGGQVLVSAVTVDLVREALPTQVRLRDLGQHQLKDLEQPECVWQVLHPEMPADFPPLTSLSVRRNNLPNPLSSFVGRDQAIAELCGLLEKARLVTLTGPGGIGKTRLAQRVAAEAQAHFPDGVWLVRLESLAQNDLVPAAIASVLGIREQPGQSLLATVTDAVGSRHLLLLLDNCEHLVQACAEVTDVLLQACPRLQFLATSREALGVQGEISWRVSPLSLPSTHTEDALAESEAARLFIQRARAVQPGFMVIGQNASAVAEVCWRLDGLPLAIELAAARMKALSVEQLAQRLDERFRLLTGGSRAALPRQQTLRAAIDWSYDLLSESEQVLFRQLGVFVGGWTLEAAEAVCGVEPILPNDTIDRLCSLVDKSLVNAEEPTGVRYRFLDTIRQYALERLEASGETQAMRRRHAEHFRALADQADPELRGASQVGWVARLEMEHDNLRAALRWCIDYGPVEHCLRLGGALSGFWLLHDHLTEGREWLVQVLALPVAGIGPAPRTRARAEALSGAGFLALRQSDFAVARSLFEESLAIRREVCDLPGVAACLNNLGVLADDQGDCALAISLHQQNLPILRELGDRLRIATSLNNLGAAIEHRAMFNSLNDEGTSTEHEQDYSLAGRILEDGLAIRRELEDSQGIADSLMNLGFLADFQGDYPTARSAFAESIAISHELGDSQSIGWALEGFAALAAVQGQAERALQLEGAAARLREILGTPLPFAERELFQRRLPTIRQMIGDAASDAAWEEGHALPLDQAIAYAIHQPLCPEVV